MAYSYTEKKRIRKDFGVLPKVMDVPYLLAIQMDSYRKFTQSGVPEGERGEHGLHAAFKEGDTLYAFSGMDTMGTLVGKGSGFGNPQMNGGWVGSNCDKALEPTGCLTFQFKTDGDNFKSAGW